MKDAGHKTAMSLARFSEFVGLIFCVLGVVSGINNLAFGELGVFWYCTY
jgi:hypothetical protein